MTTKKDTDRLKRDERIEALLGEGEDCLNKLLDRVDQKHANGGIFNNVEHHRATQMCIQTLSEDELADYPKKKKPKPKKKGKKKTK